MSNFLLIFYEMDVMDMLSALGIFLLVNFISALGTFSCVISNSSFCIHDSYWSGMMIVVIFPILVSYDIF